MAAKDVMAPSARSDSGTLQTRILSAAVMLPVAAAIVWIGGWAFILLVSVLSALMYWEWYRMPDAGGESATTRSASLYVGVAGCLLAPLPVLPIDVWITVVGGGFLMLTAVVLLQESAGHREFRLAGYIYIWLSGAAMAGLRAMPDDGLVTVIWLFGVVVATDTCAYFTGRTLGGPKLAPKISPKKTWSGLIGGVVGAAVVGVVVASIVEADMVTISLVSGGLAIIAQTGDLVVSKAKRKFDVKDSSNLIPGHGGVLDRLDGFLAVSLVMAVLSFAGGGSPLSWL